MEIAYFLVTFIIFILIRTQRVLLGKGFSLIKIFNYSWFLIFLVYLSDYYNYYAINLELCIYSVVFILSVNVTFTFFKRGNCIKSINVDYLTTDLISMSTKVRLIFLGSFLSWVISIGRLQQSINIALNEGGMIAVRSQVGSGIAYSTAEILAYQYFVQPFFIVTIILAIQNLIVSNEKNWKLIIVAFINATVYSLLFGGRSSFALIIIFTSVLLYIKNGGSIISVIRKEKRGIILLSIIFIPIYIYSSLRVTRNWGLFSEFGLYMTGGLPFLSSLMDTTNIEYGVTDGKIMFGSFYDFFGLALRVLNIDITLASQIYSSYVKDFIPIGPNLVTNYTATAILSLLLDFGVFGLILGGALYGIIFSFVENRFIKKTNIFNLALLMYVTGIAIESVQNYTFKSTVFIFVILYLWFFLRDKNKNKKMVSNIY